MKLIGTGLCLVLCSLFLFSCAKKSDVKISKSLEGFYEQIGYGRIVSITDSSFVLYDKTDLSCIPVFDGQLSIYGENLTLENDTLKLKDGINEYKYVRLSTAPEMCGDEMTEKTKNDPIFNFEVLAANFEKHYAYFELRKVNWDSLYTATKNKISSETSDPELYRILEDMLDSFNDGHIGLDAPSEVEEAAENLRVGQEEDEQEEDKVTYGDLQIAQMISDHYIKDIKTSRSKLVKWGYLENEIGFLQINLMMGHGDLSLPDSLAGMSYLRAYFDALEALDTSEEHTKLEVTGIKNTLEKVMSDLQDSKALVLDVRFNGGGKDEVALEIMRHFNDKRRLVFTKKARMNNEYTPQTKVYLDAAENAYTKPMFILTSQESASATEIMVLSSLLLEHVHRIGNRTEGVFSDVMEKALPNGWEVGLSNEVYLDTKGVNYENIGIPPSIALNYPMKRQDFFRSLANDLNTDKQKIIQEVLNILN